MPAFNVVRFKVRPGNEQRFVEAHKAMKPDFKGFIGGSLVKTGDQTFCFVGQWRNFQSIVNARPHMVSMLDQVRSLLEELSPALGVTDPISGESVVSFGASKTPAKKKAAKSRTSAKRAAGKKTGAKTKTRKGSAKKSARKR